VIERNGIAGLRLEIREFTGGRGGIERKRCLCCKEEENEIHILLKCTKAQRWREYLLEHSVVKGERGNCIQAITCNEIAELVNVGTVLYKIKCNLEN
jgi:hypothetical protein